jgi:transcriptional regulator with XRE-family HTH domain
MPTLLDARIAHQWSRLDLALRAGVGVSTIYRIEHGRSGIRPRTMRRLSNALGLRPEEITEFQSAVQALELGHPRGPKLPLPPRSSVSRERIKELRQ